MRFCLIYKQTCVDKKMLNRSISGAVTIYIRERENAFDHTAEVQNSTACISWSICSSLQLSALVAFNLQNPCVQ
jgi:hypothetical protein